MTKDVFCVLHWNIISAEEQPLHVVDAVFPKYLWRIAGLFWKKKVKMIPQI